MKRTKQLHRNKSAAGIVVPKMDRVIAEIQIKGQSEIVYGRVFLCNLYPDRVSIFTQTKLPENAEVSLVIEQPRHLFVKGKIQSCTVYNLNSRTIPADPYRFRVGIRFKFEDDAARETLKKYCDELFSGRMNDDEAA